MTQLLAQALAAVNKLPELEQDAIASLILDELSDEQRWQREHRRQVAVTCCMSRWTLRT